MSNQVSKEIDQHLKKQLVEAPKVLRKFLKENEHYSPGITYYTGFWGQDIKDNLTERQAEKLTKQIDKLSENLVLTSRKLPDNIGGYHYIAYVKKN